MYFLTDENKKIIFGWSAKCACSHIKRIFWYMKTNKLNNEIHKPRDYKGLPNDITNYTIILFSRNPYKRLISGFLDKYKVGGQYRSIWPHSTITFSNFVNELVKSNWTIVNRHHFTPQTSEAFTKHKMTKAKVIKCYDINSIDYNYIESLFDKKIPAELLAIKEGHERQVFNKSYEEYVYDLDMSIYYEYNVDIKYFFNEELKNKVYKYFENDFNFFYENGIDYKESSFLN
jgi:hypothetical protein